MVRRQVAGAIPRFDLQRDMEDAEAPRQHILGTVEKMVIQISSRTDEVCCQGRLPLGLGLDVKSHPNPTPSDLLCQHPSLWPWRAGKDFRG